MEKMSSAQLRAVFLNYFWEKGHEVVASSSLVPADDPSLLFTNAGMVRFKDIFLGRESRSYARAVSAQRCVRAGGKHNDLENVGYTARHHTFFEMLGNFSFGDYFKSEAIHFAWEFLTDVLKIPSERLWITVYKEDNEAADIWLKEVEADPARFSRIGTAANFWSMGDVGPCGPCTEIFYDHGEGIPGGPPGTADEDGDRYIELWNLVFMQYDRGGDGNLTELPNPSVDTGMGLERLAAVMQGVHNNYEIDLFQPLLIEAARFAGSCDLSQSSLRVIADHIRSSAFLVVDGVLPSNEGRGYVLRRIIRRAIRHGYRLGIRDFFFHKLVAPLSVEMGLTYPELAKSREHVERVLKKEEERFAETLDQGMKILYACVENLKDNVIPGQTVFRLYDTYGFPVDLTADFAREQGLGVDLEGFEQAMNEQRVRARSASRFQSDFDPKMQLDTQTEFTGYLNLKSKATILGMFSQGNSVTHLDAGAEGVVVLDRTPFYAESGGQVGDVGIISTADATFEVFDTQKQGLESYLHSGKVLRGTLQLNQGCDAEVDLVKRQATALNHSATHLLHATLRRVLGDHVTQKGSLVNAERLRFDFSHFEPLTSSELQTIERMVNEQIRLNALVSSEIMSKDDALNAGAMALFGEKYGNQVRVLRVGDFSTELCGGTHVNRAGDIGYFKIVGETGVAAGVRRLEAVTGNVAVTWVEENNAIMQELAAQLKGSRHTLKEKVQQALDKNRRLEKELEQLKAKMAASDGRDLSSEAVEICGLNVLVAKLDNADPKFLRQTVDQLKDKLGSAAIVLASANDDKVNLIAGVTKDQTDRIKAGELINVVATQVGGKGGGRPDMAQAGGNNPAALDGALDSIYDWIRAQLG